MKGATHLPSCLGQPPPKLAPEAAQTEQKSEIFFFAIFPSFFSFPVSVSSASAVAAHSLKRAKNQELSFLLRSLFRLKHLTRKVASQEN